MSEFPSAQQGYPAPVTSVQLSLDQQQAVLHLQHSILEMIASNNTQDEIFSKLCSMAEGLLPNSVASILMQDEHNLMQVVCAPSVPEEGKAMLGGLTPCDTSGSCGNAIYKNKPMYVFDALTDDRCLETRPVFDQFGLNACWSHPIRDIHGNAIGSFALSSFEARDPSNFHKELLAIGSYIAGITLHRSRQQEELEFLAYNDTLTGLPNRAQLFDQLKQSVARHKSSNSHFAVAFFDLNRFKSVNDIFGHSVGDAVLNVVAQRFMQNLSGVECLARVGGDEFVALICSEYDPEQVVQTLIMSLSEPISNDTQKFQISCSSGIAVFPQHGATPEELLKNSDTAMYEAKNLGIPYCFYEPAFGESTKRAFDIENDLRQALALDGFEVFYQKQVESNSSALIGYEALLRWRNSKGELIGPDEFIPIAEKTDLIVPLGEWVVRKSMEQMAQLAAVSPAPFTLSINISGAQFEKEHITKILQLVDQSDFPNSNVYFEITETVLVDEGKQSSELLDLIRNYGVKLAIDDFGAGYSSLAYLKRFKVNQLKIDRMLINDIINDEDDLSISKAVIALGHSLGLEVLAEGVELETQATVLRALNCDKFQGFYFAKPVPFDELVSASTLN